MYIIYCVYPCWKIEYPTESTEKREKTRTKNSTTSQDPLLRWPKSPAQQSDGPGWPASWIIHRILTIIYGFWSLLEVMMKFTQMR